MSTKKKIYSTFDDWNEIFINRFIDMVFIIFYSNQFYVHEECFCICSDMPSTLLNVQSTKWSWSKENSKNNIVRELLNIWWLAFSDVTVGNETKKIMW